MKNRIKNIVLEYMSDNRKTIPISELPDKLYHVTTNHKDVMSSGILLAKKGFNSGGLGGTESFGISFVLDYNIAKNIYNELSLINDINNATSEKEILNTINNLDDVDRKKYLLSEYTYYQTKLLYNNPKTSILMALRLTRIQKEFSNKPYHNIIIYNEENIKNKDIGIITINKNNISNNTKIIEGVDKHLGEIRVLGNIKL